MPSFIHIAGCAGAWAVALGVMPAAAVGQGSHGAGALVEGFTQTCLADTAAGAEEVRLSAIASGWSPQAARVISTATGARLSGAGAPKFLRKGDLTLALTPKRSGRHVCSVSASLDGPLTTRELAKLVSVQLGSSEPTILPDGRGERAIWRLEARALVEASVKRNNSLRSVELVVRPDQAEFALRD